MALPNVLLAGAPKCATTSVHRWLVSQPGVASAQRKETFYLLDAEHPLLSTRANVHAHGLEGYARLFPSAEQARLRVDATTHHLYSLTAPRVAASLDEKPKVVFLLRDPAARAFSSFRFSQQTLAVLDASVDFARFVSLVDRGIGGLRGLCRSEGSRYVLERDLEYGYYARYLDRWREAIGDENMLVLLTEDLSRDTSMTLARVADFLDLSLDELELRPMESANETFAVRHRAVHALATRASEWLLQHPRARKLASQVYWSIQSRDAASEITEADQRAIEALRTRYHASNERLASDYGLDLSAWSQPPLSRDSSRGADA